MINKSLIPQGFKDHVDFNTNVEHQYKNKNNADIINFIYTGGTAERKGWKIIEEAFDYLLKKYPNKIRYFHHNDESDVTKRIHLLSKKISTKYTLLIFLT